MRRKEKHPKKRAMIIKNDDDDESFGAPIQRSPGILINTINPSLTMPGGGANRSLLFSNNL
jgi:hypothetical protein